MGPEEAASSCLADLSMCLPLIEEGAHHSAVNKCAADSYEEWEAGFGLENMFIVRHADLKNKNKRTKLMNALQNFLGLESFEWPDDVLFYEGHNSHGTRSEMEVAVDNLMADSTISETVVNELSPCWDRVERWMARMEAIHDSAL